MDCKTARFLLGLARPGSPELEPGESAALETHLAACNECDTLARGERRFDEQLGRAMRTVPVPEGLRGRILDRLPANGADRRRAWRWPARLVTAAAFLIAAGLGVGYWLSSKLPELNVEELRTGVYQRMARSRDGVEKYFADRYQLTVTAPDHFNYALLRDCHLEKVQGRQIPVLVFVEGRQSALVYIISGTQFDQEALVRDGPANSGGLTTEVWEDAAFTYLIFYTGDSLRRFLTSEPPQPLPA
jgi:hypothetical protein